jgi:hypothetical protein
VDVASVSLCRLWHEEPDVDGALDVVVEVLVRAVVVANALGLAGLAVAVAVECCLEEQVELLIHLHDSNDLPAGKQQTGGRVKPCAVLPYYWLSCNDLVCERLTGWALTMRHISAVTAAAAGKQRYYCTLHVLPKLLVRLVLQML